MASSRHIRACNRQIRAYCEAHGWRYKPWETAPWEADAEDCPWPPQSGGAKTWPKAREMRAKILATLGLEDH